MICIPTQKFRWYTSQVSDTTTHAITVGDRGRFVLPLEVRDRHGWEQGTPLVAVDTDEGLLVMSVEESLRWLRQRISGRDLVAELLDERHAENERESS